MFFFLKTKMTRKLDSKGGKAALNVPANISSVYAKSSRVRMINSVCCLMKY